MPITISPAETTTSVLATRAVNPGRILRLLLLALAFLSGALRAPAEIYQTIVVSVVTPEKVRVARIDYPFSDTMKAVAAQVHGTNPIRVKIFVFVGVDMTLVEQIKDYCRKAGATSFFIVRKA